MYADISCPVVRLRIWLLYCLWSGKPHSPPKRKGCPGYDIQLHPLVIWEVYSTSSLALLPSLFWLGMVVSVRYHKTQTTNQPLQSILSAYSKPCWPGDVHTLRISCISEFFLVHFLSFGVFELLEVACSVLTAGKNNKDYLL